MCTKLDFLHLVGTHTYLVSLNSVRSLNKDWEKLIFSAMGPPQRVRLLPEDHEKMLGSNSKQNYCAKDACCSLLEDLGVGL